MVVPCREDHCNPHDSRESAACSSHSNLPGIPHSPQPYPTVAVPVHHTPQALLLSGCRATRATAEEYGLLRTHAFNVIPQSLCIHKEVLWPRVIWGQVPPRCKEMDLKKKGIYQNPRPHHCILMCYNYNRM